MLKIRLTKVGAKNDPKFRIVVAPARSKRDGKFLAILGYYHPMVKKNNFKIDTAKFNFWIKAGAQPTLAILKLLSTQKLTKNNDQS